MNHFGSNFTGFSEETLQRAPLHIPSNEPERAHVPQDEGKLALDIFETEAEIFIVAPLAGVGPDEVEISVNEEVLTIRGKREFPDKLPEAKSFFTEECFWGTFSRSIVLPYKISPIDIKAKMKKNVLVIKVPKSKATFRKVQIESQ